jgi:hypothetical protein
MSAYHQEQIDAIAMVAKHLKSNPSARPDLLELIADYLSFRGEVDRFLSTHFSKICTQTCYQNRLSACCSREGIITFFADIVVNVLVSDSREIEDLIKILDEPNTGFKCVYLTETGCRWKVKPIVCEMFLCDTAKDTVLAQNSQLKREWVLIEEKRKQYTWPDQPVLFDKLEAYFMAAGCRSPLMYLHNSPGLLRVKQKAGLIN